MHPKYPNVFNPIKLGPIEVANRFYSSPHAVPLNILGKPSVDFISYNVARAKGGCGLLILSMAAHDRLRTVWPNIAPKDHQASFRALTEGVHEAGGKIFGEPWYYWGLPGQWNPFSPPAPALTPSVSQFRYHEKPSSTRPMTRDDIRGVLRSFRNAARNLRESGFDGMMLHAAHGALLEQFLSPYFNRRSDEYGGSLANRLRFVMEALDAAHDGARGEIAVGMRLNCDELVTGGYGTEQAYEILTHITRSGLLDFVDLDVAVEPNQFWLGMPNVFVEPHVYRPYVEAVRGAAGKVPVMSVLGRLTSLADGEAAIAAGVCDMVGAARALIAEPNLVRNAAEGKEERSRTCIACNWCLQSMLDEYAQTCTINPTSYRERFWDEDELSLASSRGKVVVVGGGPCGLEAARTSALRGHDVILFEAEMALGGAFALWAGLPGREFFHKALHWWERELQRLGVTVRLGVHVGEADVLAEEPTAVILATGSRYSAMGFSAFADQPLPGHNLAHVCVPEDVLTGRVRPRGNVLILDAEGLNTGVGVAEVLARNGASVELLTPSFAPVSQRVNGAEETRFIMKRLREAGVVVSPTSYVKEILADKVVAYDVYTEEERDIVDLDAVVLVTSRQSVNGLEQALLGKVAQLFTAGDAASARMWAAATYEGHMFARLIGEPGAAASTSEAYFADFDMTSLPIPGDMKLG